MVILLSKRSTPKLPQDDLFLYKDWRNPSSISPWSTSGSINFNKWGAISVFSSGASLEHEAPGDTLTEATLAVSFLPLEESSNSTSVNFTLGHETPSVNILSVFYIPGFFKWGVTRRWTTGGVTESIVEEAWGEKMGLIGRWNGSTLKTDVFMPGGNHSTQSAAIGSATGTLSPSGSQVVIYLSDEAYCQRSALWTRELSDEEVLQVATVFNV